MDPTAALYADDAVFHSHPFREHQSPRAYVEWAFADQARAECRFAGPIVDGDRAAVEWWAVLTTHEDAVETIAGVSVLRFDARGLVVEQRDAWAAEGGALVPPAWASRADG